MRTFTGVLAVFDRPSTEGRVIPAPAKPWPEAEDPDLRWPLVVRTPGEHIVGIIKRLWIDGDLLRYSGTFDDETYPAHAAQIDSGEIVGHLDLTTFDTVVDEAGGPVVADGWQVNGAYLAPDAEKAWPEVALDLGHIPNPTPFRNAGGMGIYGDQIRVNPAAAPFNLGGATVQSNGSIRIDPA